MKCIVCNEVKIVIKVIKFKFKWFVLFISWLRMKYFFNILKDLLCLISLMLYFKGSV